MTLYHTPTAFCTADQLYAPGSETISWRGRAEREKLVEFCKALTGIYPDLTFYTHGWDREGCTDVGEVSSRIYLFRGTTNVGQLDVDYVGADIRYTLVGRHVEGADAGWDKQKVWRKDPAKLLGLIASGDFLRFDNPEELYQAAKRKAEGAAAGELYGIEQQAEKLVERARIEAVALACGKAPSPGLAELLAQVSEWRATVAAVEASLKLENERLAASFGVTPHKASAVTTFSALEKLLEATK